MRHRRRRLARNRRNARCLGFRVFALPAVPDGEYWDLVSWNADGFTLALRPQLVEPMAFSRVVPEPDDSALG
ncbi:MAG TPA: hypothetical protein VFZ21_31670 [Gemmatimonadaceae bacterium]|nr:hypothetical protein [Gemmatimonadaceae bacterium]